MSAPYWFLLSMIALSMVCFGAMAIIVMGV